MVVTTATLGMRIDVPNIKTLINFDYEDVESYIQAVRRAGRDGKPSKTNKFLELLPINL